MVETALLLSSRGSCFEFGAVVFETRASCLREAHRGGGGVVVVVGARASRLRREYRLKPGAVVFKTRASCFEGTRRHWDGASRSRGDAASSPEPSIL
jgi:hypothetical protein